MKKDNTARYTVRQMRAVLFEADPLLVVRFWEYHRAHPEVFEAFCARAREMRDAGRKRYSAWGIVQRIRWEHDIQQGTESFKINNDFIGLFSRLLVHVDPSFEGFFQHRAMKPDDRRVSGEERYRQ